MDISKYITDIHNSIVYINNWITNINKRTIDINNWITYIHKMQFNEMHAWVKTAAIQLLSVSQSLMDINNDIVDISRMKFWISVNIYWFIHLIIQRISGYRLNWFTDCINIMAVLHLSWYPALNDLLIIYNSIIGTYRYQQLNCKSHSHDFQEGPGVC